jgi:excisionase family DNA binding protein
MAVATITDMEGLPAVLTMRHVRQILGVSRGKAYDLAQQPDFPVIRLGRTIRVPRAALMRWIDRQAGAGDEQ